MCRIKYISLLATFILASIISRAQKTEAFQWMVGNWKINTANGTIVESWRLLNDSTLQGMSVFVKNNSDSILQETIQVAFRNGDWYYIPVAYGQNNNQPVQFKLIFLKGTEFIAENPAHDFPQRISYRRIKQQLFASIEGRKNGKYGKQNFDFSGDH